jgi:hypothetical protein
MARATLLGPILLCALLAALQECRGCMRQPTHLVCAQIKQLYVPVVIPCQHTALIIIEGVSKGYTPAVPAATHQQLQ